MTNIGQQVQSIVERNQMMNQEFQEMKNDLASLADKILDISVRSRHFFEKLRC